MNDIETKKDLVEIITNMSSLENDRLLLWATIYTRKCEEVKQSKLSDLRRYFDTQLNFYKRGFSKYEEQYRKLEKEYEDKMAQLINQYTIEYQYIQNEEVLANSNQKIAVSNFIISKREQEKAQSIGNAALIEKSERKMYATAQKKLNYDVIIDECNGRLEKCMNDTYTKLEEIFDVSDKKMEIKKTSIISSVKHFLKIRFTGDSCFKKYVLDDLKTKFHKIENDFVSAVSDVKIEMMVLISQMEKVKSDVNISFNETLNKGIC